MTMQRDETKKPTLLIADDDLYYLDTLTTFFSQQGYTVLQAGCGTSLEKAVFRHRVDCAILDYHLPGTRYRIFFARLRERDMLFPFVIMTGDPSPAVEKDARSFSPAFFFVKPLSLVDVRDVIDNVLKKDRSNEYSHH